jgi:hypothetical protein
MYFNHAFRKSFLVGDDGIVGSAVALANSGTTAALAPGKLGLFNAKTYGIYTPGVTPFILAQGSFFKLPGHSDKIGPVHGGYQESVKSKAINPKYISRVFTTCAVAPQNQIITIGWNLDTEAPVGFQFECGKTYRLRVDLKGSPALRFLSHNVYRVVDAFSGCCTDDCSATCTGAAVDAACVLLKWKDQLMRTPLTSSFIMPRVYINDGGDVVEVFSDLDVEMGRDEGQGAYTCVTDPTLAGSVIAGLEIEVAYVETKFGNCTFTPTDFYELQPLQIFASVMDETGEPCAIKPTGNSSSEYSATGTTNLIQETQIPMQAQGVGESVLRDMILTGRYRQEAYPDSSRVEHLRMREIEANPGLETIDRNGFYNTVNILHNVPRLNNPTGTFDNDQYLLTIYIPAGVNAYAFITTLQSILTAAGNGVTVEHISVDGGSACLDFQAP